MRRRLLLTLWSWFVVVGAMAAEPIQIKHEQMLYPVVRVTTKAAGGSGTILYSEDRGTGCETFVITNDHVIADACTIKTEFSPLLQADVKHEVVDEVKVEIFRYSDGSNQDMADACQSEIVAHSRTEDLALLKLKTNRKFNYVAKFLPPEGKVHIFDETWAVGCSLLHPPIASQGTINYLNETIDNRLYWMSNSQIVFGNSGGAVFTQQQGRYYWIGVPSRVAGTWNQILPHMGWFVPIPRVREWIANEKLDFLVNPKVKPVECFKLRQQLRKEAEQRMLFDRKQEGPLAAPKG